MMELTRNLLIDTREKNDGVIAEIKQRWREISGGEAIVHGLGLRGGDYALEALDEETGEVIPHPDFRVEAKWMSSSGPTDLFRSTTAHYTRLKAEMESFNSWHRHSLFICQGKASDFRRHVTQGKVTWDKVLGSVFALNTKFRVPFLFSDWAVDWLISFFWSAAKFKGEKLLPDVNEPRPYLIVDKKQLIRNVVHSDYVDPGTQFFLNRKDFDTQTNAWLSSHMIRAGFGFWFFDDTDQAELEQLAEKWQKLEIYESSIRAAGGFTTAPESYCGALNTFEHYKPRKIHGRKRRHPVVIFSPAGDEPLIIMFEVPKDRGSEVHVMKPAGPGGPIDLDAVTKPSEVYYCAQLFKIKSLEKTEREMVPEILRRCHQYWSRGQLSITTKEPECESSSESSESSIDSDAEPAEDEDSSLSSTVEPEPTSQPVQYAEEAVVLTTPQSVNEEIDLEHEPEEPTEESMNLPAKQEGGALLSQCTPEEIELAALRACGLGDAPKDMQIVAMQKAQMYGLDLALKHIVPIKNDLYITRDGLLRVAHDSGQLDGIVVDEQGENEREWRAAVSVYRKDMKHAFRYVGRYPKGGKNAKYGPEMAVKRAECMALKRAFDISMTSSDELDDVKDVEARVIGTQVNAPEKVIEPGQVIIEQNAPSSPSEDHKHIILEGFKSAGVPLDPWLESLATYVYKQPGWEAWKPSKDVAVSASAFIQIFGWIVGHGSLEFAMSLIDQDLIPLDMIASSPTYFVNYIKANCSDMKVPEAFQQTVHDALENLPSTVLS